MRRIAGGPGLRRLGWYSLGLGTGLLAALASGPLGRVLRPAAKRTLKSGLLLRREVERRAEEARSTFDDLVAEANAEIEAEDAARGGGEA
jgi:hypothetical protein